MNTDIDYGFAMRVMSEIDMPFSEIKRRLIRGISEQVIPDMVDSGNFHVMKFDIAKKYNPIHDWNEYVIKVKTSIAEIRHIQLPSFDTITYQGEKYERVCNYCGNALMLSTRGACNACGAPNGGYK